jgi:hypothetical protein
MTSTISEKLIKEILELFDKKKEKDDNFIIKIKDILKNDLLKDSICNSYTLKGTRCKKQKKKDELYCSIHLKEKNKLKEYLLEKNITDLNQIEVNKVEEKVLYESEDEGQNLSINESEDESDEENNLIESEDESNDEENNDYNDFEHVKHSPIIERKKIIEVNYFNIEFNSNDELDYDE